MPRATPPPSPTPFPFQDTVDSMAALTGGLQIPEHLLVEDAVKTGEEFDANTYFQVLDHLSMEPGYVLDYVYCYDFMGGYPLLYARLEGQPPYRTCSDFQGSGSDYLSHVRIDDTPEGYFQFVTLVIMGGQFYLHWHANYNDLTIIADSAALEAVLSATPFDLEIPPAVQRQARRLSLEPRIEIGEDAARVRIVTFTKWGGFQELTVTISRSFPHTILDWQEKTLVPYDCGVMF